MKIKNRFFKIFKYYGDFGCFYLSENDRFAIDRLTLSGPGSEIRIQDQGGRSAPPHRKSYMEPFAISYQYLISNIYTLGGFMQLGWSIGSKIKNAGHFKFLLTREIYLWKILKWP